jgi:tRNA 2-thiocytidine biosynthesis protein TtcA
MYCIKHLASKTGKAIGDFIETLLLNQFLNGHIKAMTPLLYSDDGTNTVIRPLCYVNEESIIDFI